MTEEASPEERGEVPGEPPGAPEERGAVPLGLSAALPGLEQGGIDMGALFSHLGRLQQGLAEAQSAAEQELEGRAGGGAVKVSATGALEFRRVEIDPSVVDPGEVEMLEDLVLAALRDVVEQARALQAEALGGMGLGGLLGG